MDGLDVEQVWQNARQAIELARSGNGPTFLHAHCVHLEGHFLGLLPIRAIRNPFRELPAIVGPLVHSFLRPGNSSLSERFTGVKFILSTILATLRDPRRNSLNDPVARVRVALMSDPERLKKLENQTEAEIAGILSSALEEMVV
jgi:hypothetical protein